LIGKRAVEIGFIQVAGRNQQIPEAGSGPANLPLESAVNSTIGRAARVQQQFAKGFSMHPSSHGHCRTKIVAGESRFGRGDSLLSNSGCIHSESMKVHARNVRAVARNSA
jgi:hypothetical protein